MSIEAKVEARLREAKDLAHELLSGPCYEFANLTSSSLEKGREAVYAVFDHSDGSTLYVGRTKNIRQRLYNNHLNGTVNGARLKKYLMEDTEKPEIRTTEDARQYLIDHCYFWFVLLENVRLRGQVEGLFSYLLDVKYIHEEH